MLEMRGEAAATEQLASRDTVLVSPSDEPTVIPGINDMNTNFTIQESRKLSAPAAALASANAAD